MDVIEIDSSSVSDEDNIPLAKVITGPVGAKAKISEKTRSSISADDNEDLNSSVTLECVAIPSSASVNNESKSIAKEDSSYGSQCSRTSAAMKEANKNSQSSRKSSEKDSVLEKTQSSQLSSVDNISEKFQSSRKSSATEDSFEGIQSGRANNQEFQAIYSLSSDNISKHSLHSSSHILIASDLSDDLIRSPGLYNSNEPSSSQNSSKIISTQRSEPGTSKSARTSNNSQKIIHTAQTLFEEVADNSDVVRFISPIIPMAQSHMKTHYSPHLDFDATTATNSTPKDIESCATQFSDSTEELLGLQTVTKKIAFHVDVSVLLHLSKDKANQFTGELINVHCENEKASTGSSIYCISESSGYLADGSSKLSSSPTSIKEKVFLNPRISMLSSSSSSSIASSASAYMAHKKEDIKVSSDRLEQLKEKWLNSTDIYKILDYIDRHISIGLSPESDENHSSGKIKKPLAELNENMSAKKSRQPRVKRQPKTKLSPSNSDSEVARKRRRADLTTEIYPTPNKSNFSVGDSVFAKWIDRKFYAATLRALCPDGKWKVLFFDGDEKMLLEKFIIKAEEFTMVGHSVYASQGDDNFTPGIITGCELKSGVMQYIVARDKGDISVPCQFIYITECQARQIRGKSNTSFQSSSSAQKSTSMDTSVPANKRTTRSNTRLLLDSPKPSSSGTQKAVVSDSDDDENDGTHNIVLEYVAGVEPESSGVYENCIKLKGKTVTGKMRFARTKSNDSDASILGPIPEAGSKFFKNLHVLLACTKFRPIASENVTSGSESENYIFSSIPFVRERLKLQLTQGGAVVYQHFDDIPNKVWRTTYLISNRPNLSGKYIQCIAAGIKLVCHEWVIRCCNERRRLPFQELPLGWSVEAERFFNYADRKATHALKKLHILISEMGTKYFYKFWAKVCKIADIRVAKLTRDSNLEVINAVVCESGYRDGNIDRVVSHSVPLVTTTWLVQTIMYGEPRPYTRQFLAEYIDSD